MSEFEDGDDWHTEFSIWVSTRKTAVEFEKSLSQIINPVVIENRYFHIGAIEIQIKDVIDQPLSYEGVPPDRYAFELVIPTSQALIWGCFDRKVVYAITVGLRTKFTCSYLVTADTNIFAFYSGTNKPIYINLNYPPCTDGELLPIYRDMSHVVELNL